MSKPVKRKKAKLPFKIDLRPEAELSAHFNNRRDCYKVVETGNVLSYVVSSGGRGGAALICPLYSATIYIKGAATWHMVSSYEHGDRLNDYTFQTDPLGCTLATIAAQAIAALEARRPVQQPLKRAESKKRGRHG